jgi:hypothetical protein
VSLGGIGPYYRRVAIDALPDDALLEIFKFYVDEVCEDPVEDVDGWHTLVHVCRKWRDIVFSSPRRLNLRLLCAYRRSVTEMLNIWPELPINVRITGGPNKADEIENHLAALELTDRVSEIYLEDNPTLELERFVAAMRVPFPVLTRLDIWWSRWDDPESGLVLSDEFLGGSAPRLQSLRLGSIPFLALPTLLLSTTDLVTLDLEYIPHSGYISPDEMVASLTMLTRLDRLSLGFRSPLSRPSQTSRHLPPPTRTVLPALTCLMFRGVTEYLEDFVARIDVPLLREASIRFFNQLVFDIVQLPRFLDRIDGFAVLDSANVVLYANVISVTLSAQSRTAGVTPFGLWVSCSKLDWQLSSLSRLSASTLSTLFHLEHLDISESQYIPPQYWQDDIENIQWLELLHPFCTVKNLYLSKQVVARIAPALQELARERVIDVLPMLQVLSLDEPEPSGPVHERKTRPIHIFLNGVCFPPL